MTEIAPLPPGYPKPIDADTLPTRTAHPLEAWAAPSPAFEEAITRPLEGGGYVSMTRSAYENYVAADRRLREMIGPGIKHASEIAAETRQREEEAEEKRKASDPRAVLRAAHTLQTEALERYERLETRVTLARRLVDGLSRRVQEHEAAVTAVEQAAVEALIEAISAGGAAVPAAAPDPDVTGAATTAAELAIARAALAKLKAELVAANDRVARCRAGVARCALAVLADQAADRANEIIADQAALDQRRADLDTLAVLLTNEARRLDRVPAALPPQISRAIYPSDPVLTGADRGLALTNWRAEYDRLCRGEGHP